MRDQFFLQRRALAGGTCLLTLGLLLASLVWAVSPSLPPGQALREPAPLFKKLDESVIEEEYARLES